jgi:FkbM family methyltransferase
MAGLFGLVVTRQPTFERLIASERELKRLRESWDFLRQVKPAHVHRAIDLLPLTSGENFQDLFAALILGDRESGFFVEFGATDGVSGSNSLYFERHAGWRGVLAEPARVWHARLAENRSCVVAHECVWSKGGETLEFSEADDAGFSTISSLASRDRHASKREGARNYPVNTITLDALLDRHDAPARIDFMSLDTEGSELEILSVFSFQKRQVCILVVEHNFRPERDAIHELLVGHGMKRVLTGMSKYDDWYVSGALASKVDEVFHGVGREGA